MADLSANCICRTSPASKRGLEDSRFAGRFLQFLERTLVLFEFLAGLGKLTLGRETLILIELLNRTID